MIWPARQAHPDDHATLAALWHQGWHDGHGAHTPRVVVAACTLAFFAAKLPTLGLGLRVAGPPARPLGLCATTANDIDLLVVAPQPVALALPLPC